VDNRLFELYGKRPVKLRKDDLGVVAQMLIAVLRHRGKADITRRSGIEAVILSDNRQRVITILKDDWEKIAPFLEDGTFDPLLTPAASDFGYLQKDVVFDEPVETQADKHLYQLILNTLTPLFSESFPTTNI